MSVDSGDASAPRREAGQDDLDLRLSNPEISIPPTAPLFPWKTEVNSADVAASRRLSVIAVGSHQSSAGPDLKDTVAGDYGIPNSRLDILTALAVDGSGICAPVYPPSVSSTSGANRPVLDPAPEKSGGDDEPELRRPGQE